MGILVSDSVPFIQTFKKLWQGKLLWELRQARWRFLLVDCWRARRRGKLFSVYGEFCCVPRVYACMHAAQPTVLCQNGSRFVLDS